MRRERSREHKKSKTHESLSDIITMPVTVETSLKQVAIEPLTPASFAAFGTVIQNPSTAAYQYPKQAVEANQGSAYKYMDISPLVSSYEMSRSTKPALPRMTLFSCEPRTLQQSSTGEDTFHCKILERHPFTPQTFIPIDLSATDKDTAYLVIVAPTLPISRSQPMLDEFRELRSPPYPVPERSQKPSLRQRLLGGRPNPFTNDYQLRTTPSSLPASDPVAVSTTTPKGPGAPDLDNVKAFIARGDQAVTYGAGTWHAPMVVLGSRPVDFVVVQYMNGVEAEDCQEVEISGDGVHIGIDFKSSARRQAKL